MTNIRYEFDELEIMPGLTAYCYGYAEIKGSYQSAEPDVGIMSGCFEWEVESIYLSHSRGDGETQIDSKHPLYSLIEEALYRDCDESIDEELKESDEPDPDYDRD